MQMSAQRKTALRHSSGLPNQPPVFDGLAGFAKRVQQMNDDFARLLARTRPQLGKWKQALSAVTQHIASRFSVKLQITGSRDDFSVSRIEQQKLRVHPDQSLRRRFPEPFLFFQSISHGTGDSGGSGTSSFSGGNDRIHRKPTFLPGRNHHFAKIEPNSI
ncbi:hypothetical protein D3C81_1170960 [compost metagenome]